MSTLKLALSGDLKHVFIGKDTVTFPSTYGAPIALPNFDHNESDDPVHAVAANHTLWHHIRDTLYKRKKSDGSTGATYPNGIYNMQEISIIKYGSALLAKWLSAADVTRAGAGTITPVIKYHETVDDAGVNAVLADFSWVSATPEVATVNAATGIITYVGVGTSVITATELNPTPGEAAKTVSFVATMT
jgi:hypothetical protein